MGSLVVKAVYEDDHFCRYNDEAKMWQCQKCHREWPCDVVLHARQHDRQNFGQTIRNGYNKTAEKEKTSGRT